MASRASTSALVAILLVRLVDESATFLPSAALESFRADLGLSYAQAGAVLALIAPGSVAGSLFSVAADRVSRRLITAGGALGFGLCLAVFAAGESFAVLAAAAFLIGVSATAMVDAAEIALVDLVGEADLRAYLARSNLLATIGDVLGPVVVAGVAVVGLSWRVTFWIGAVLLSAYGAALALSPIPPPSLPPADRPRASPVRTVLAVARDRRVWLVGAISMLMGPFDEPLLGFTIALLEQERQASAAAATVVAVVGVSGGVVAFAVLARRFAAVPESTLLVAAAFTMTVGATAIAVVPLVAMVAVATFVAAIGLNLAWLALQHRTLTLRPGEVGATTAVISTIEVVGFLVPVAIGAVADRTSLSVAIGCYGVLGLALTGLAMAARRAERRTPTSTDAAPITVGPDDTDGSDP